MKFGLRFGCFIAWCFFMDAIQKAYLGQPANAFWMIGMTIFWVWLAFRITRDECDERQDDPPKTSGGM